MDAAPRQALCRLIAQYGHPLASDARRCEGLLRDFCGQHRREIHVLIGALKEGVARDLLASSVSVPRDVILARLTRRLHDNLGFAEEYARWAVETWALALGKLKETELSAAQPAARRNTRAATAPTPPKDPAVTRQHRGAAGRKDDIGAAPAVKKSVAPPPPHSPTPPLFQPQKNVLLVKTLLVLLLGFVLVAILLGVIASQSRSENLNDSRYLTTNANANRPFTNMNSVSSGATNMNSIGTNMNAYAENMNAYPGTNMNTYTAANMNAGSVRNIGPPAGSIQRVWVDHNVQREGRQGMLIHIKFSVSNLYNVRCQVAAYFHHESGGALRDRNGRYNSVNGDVSVGADFVPSYVDALYEDFPLFMPYDELHITGRGAVPLRLQVEIFDLRAVTSLAQSNYLFFTYSQ